MFIIFSLEPHKNKQRRKKNVSKTAREILREDLILEIEFYDWLKGKLNEDYRSMMVE